MAGVLQLGHRLAGGRHHRGVVVDDHVADRLVELLPLRHVVEHLRVADPVFLGVEGPDQVVAVLVVQRRPEGHHVDVALAHQRDGALRADPVELLAGARLDGEQPDLQYAIVVSHAASPMCCSAHGEMAGRG